MTTRVNKRNDSSGVLHAAIGRVAAGHIWLAFILIVQILIYDAWELITPEAVIWRWLIAGGLFVVAITVWYAVHMNRNIVADKLLWTLIVCDILVASFSVYTQRGMAARAVALYAIPIVVAALFGRAAALFMTAALCVVAYVVAAASYFVLNFNEGYKVELYGEVSFYSVFFLILAALVWVVVRPKR